jgi:hypothetical protein
MEKRPLILSAFKQLAALQADRLTNWPRVLSGILVVWPGRLVVAIAVMVSVASLPAAPAATSVSPRPTLPVEGPAFVASLVAVAADGTVTFEVDGQRRQAATSDLVMWGAPRGARRGPQVVTADGSLLVGSRLRLDANQLRLDSSCAGPMALPRSVVRGIILKPSADRLARSRLRMQSVAQQRDNDQLILINGDHVAGKVTEIGDTEIAIATDVGDVRIKTARVAALFLRGPPGRPSAGQGARLLVGFRDGTLLRAESLTVTDAAVFATLVCGVDYAGCRPADLTYFQPLEARAIYLSDLPSSQYEHVPYLTLKWPFYRDCNVLGGRLRCQGRYYCKGLGMHTASRLVYQFERPYRRFESEVAVDDAAGRHRGSVLFRVTTHTESGWRETYVSPILRGGEPPVSVSVDLAGTDAIQLEVDTADHGDQLDYADWLNPRLVK